MCWLVTITISTAWDWSHQSKFILFTCNNIDFLQSDPHSCKPNNKLLLLAMNSVGEDVTPCQTAHERLQRIFWCSKIIVSDEVEVWFFWRSKRSDVMLPVLGGLRYLGKNKWLWDYAGLNIRPFFGFWTLRLFFPPFNSCFFHVNKSTYLSSFSVTIMRLNFESEVGANKFLVHVYICYMYI